jgi:hypothetical protein
LNIEHKIFALYCDSFWLGWWVNVWSKFIAVLQLKTVDVFELFDCFICAKLDQQTISGIGNYRANVSIGKNGLNVQWAVTFWCIASRPKGCYTSSVSVDTPWTVVVSEVTVL